MQNIILVIHFGLIIFSGLYILGLLLLEVCFKTTEYSVFKTKKVEVKMFSFSWLIWVERLTLTFTMILISIIWEFELITIITTILCGVLTIQVAAIASRLEERALSISSGIQIPKSNHYRNYICIECIKFALILISLYLHIKIIYS